MTDAKPDPNDRNTPKHNDDKPSPAGPHDRPDLTDADKTPGTGSLPEPKGDDADAGVG